MKSFSIIGSYFVLFTNINHILPAEYLLGIYYFGKFYLSILDWLMEGVFSFAKKPCC